MDARVGIEPNSSNNERILRSFSHYASTISRKQDVAIYSSLCTVLCTLQFAFEGLDFSLLDLSHCANMTQLRSRSIVKGARSVELPALASNCYSWKDVRNAEE